ncbi:MAG: Peptidase rane alanine aminopeptidase [Bacteroidota bacterium]|nr:Peptidase rane alanine aminopeptidase [Bacteroidota bacterium]
MLHRFVVFVGLVVFAASCHTSKKAVNSGKVEQDLETVEIAVSRDNDYRGSAPKDFDLVHTKLEVKFDYTTQHLLGKATITLKPHFYAQKELVLDAKEFDIHEVSLVNGENSREALRYTYDSLKLKIQLNKEYLRDELLKVYIDYTAKPNERKSGGSAAINDDKGLYFINPTGKDSSKPIQIWTQGETESNSCWFPTIDKPNQRCTDEIYITRLKKYVSLSNGTLISSVSVNDSLVTDYWRMGLPHAPYLFMMAVGDFAIIKDRWRDIPVDYYVEKDYAPYAKQIFGKTPEMIEFFSQKLGFDYPWPKYSQVVVRDYVSGAMENTSSTLHGEFMQRNSRELLDNNFEEVISHELFHQWFGDLVTTESWSNVPLNESFATYGEYMWNEYKYGREYADYEQNDDYRKYIDEAKDKNVDLIRFHYDDREDMFDRHSYEKGGLILHYLRKVVGDEAFFKSLELYLKNNQFKSVEVHNLRLAFEEVTGQDLNWFFNEWFLNSGHPVMDIKYTYDNDSIYVAVEQKHNIEKGLVYQLPFKINAWYGKSVKTYDVTLKKKSQIFAFKSDSKPDLVDFDPEYTVPCARKDNKTTDNYIFEYRNGPYYKGKLEALRKLAEVQKQNPAAKDVLVEALGDKFFALRSYAITKLDLPKEGSDSILGIILNLAKTDKESSVRKSAVDKLGKSSSASKYTAFLETAVGDSSYEVAGAALKALDEADSKKAMLVAKQFETEKNGNIVSAVADIYSKEGDSGYQNFFETKLRKATGFSKYTLMLYYANFLTRMDKAMVLNGIKTLEEQSNTDNHFIIGAAKGALKRITKSFEEKKKKAQSDLLNEPSQTAKLDLQEKVTDYDLIVGEANDAIQRINKKGE